MAFEFICSFANQAPVYMEVEQLEEVNSLYSDLVVEVNGRHWSGPGTFMRGWFR